MDPLWIVMFSIGIIVIIGWLLFRWLVFTIISNVLDTSTAVVREQITKAMK
jgi:hypothetical protein